MKFRNHSYYDGIFSTFGGGSARGSGMFSNGCGKGCSDGQGIETTLYGEWADTGYGRGMSTGSGYEHDKYGVICLADPPTLYSEEYEFFGKSRKE